jgi:UDP-glucose 4-epimerase
VNELAKEIISALGIKSELRYLEARNEVLHAHADHSKVKKIFGEHPSTSLRDGIIKMAEWAKRSGIRKSERFKAIEITEKLPPIWLED